MSDQLSSPQAIINRIRNVEITPLDFVMERAFLQKSDPVFLLQQFPWVRFALYEKKQMRKIVHIPITRLSGITNGKQEHGVEYPTFYHYSLKLNDDYSKGNRIGFRSNADFINNKKYINRRAAYIGDSPDGIFTLFHVTWNNRYYLYNIDGAHHLAAIYRQCHDQNRQFQLPCRIAKIHPTKHNLAIFTDRPLLIVNKNTAAQISSVVRQIDSHSYLNVNCHSIGTTRALVSFQCEKWIYQAIMLGLKKRHTHAFVDISLYIKKLIKV